MNTASDDRQEWEPCETGLLVDYANRARLAQRRRVALGGSAGAMVAVCVIGLGVLATSWWSSPREYHFGGIACHEVQENMPAMMAGTLPDDLEVRMSAHLQECPVCRKLMENMQENQASGRALRDYWVHDRSDCQPTFAQHVARARPPIEQDIAAEQDSAVFAMTYMPFHGGTRP